MSDIVWLTRETKRDVSDAERFGKICPVFAKDVNPIDSRHHAEIIRETVASIASADDHIVTAGPTAMVCSLVSYFVARFGHANLLVYDARRGSYARRRV